MLVRYFRELANSYSMPAMGVGSGDCGKDTQVLILLENPFLPMEKRQNKISKEGQIERGHHAHFKGKVCGVLLTCCMVADLT